MKGRDGGRSRANCGLDSINEGEPGSERSVPLPRRVRASYRRSRGFSARFQEVHERNGAVGAYRGERNTAGMKSKYNELKECQS